MDDCDYFLDGGAKSNTQLDQPGSFCWRYGDPFGQLAPQDTILRLKVLDVEDEFFLSCLSNEHE